MSYRLHPSARSSARRQRASFCLCKSLVSLPGLPSFALCQSSHDSDLAISKLSRATVRNFFGFVFMAFFLPSSTSTSTSTTTSLSSSPLPVLRPLDSEDESKQSHDGNGSLRHRQSEDFPSTRSGFTMFGLLSRRIDYISGASASDISSLESSESEVESWTRRSTFGDDNDDEFDRHTNTRTSRSTRDARSPSGHSLSPDIHHPVAELSVGTSRSHGARTTHHTGPSTSEPNVASSTNQIEGEETVRRRRNRRHGPTEADRSRTRRVKLRNRRNSNVYEAVICTS